MELTELSALDVDGQIYELSESTYQTEPVLSPGPGMIRIGSSRTLTAVIRIRAATQALLTAALVEAQTRLAVSAVRVAVSAFGTTEIELKPADYVDGGPHVSFVLGKQVAGLERTITVTVKGQTASDSDGGGGGSGSVNDASHTISTAITPMGTQKVTRSGTYVGSNAWTKYTSLEQAWANQYGWPNYVVERTIKQGVAGTSVQYELTSTEAVGSYFGTSNGAKAVDGEVTDALETDYGTSRQTRRVTANLAVNGDPWAIADQIRAWLMDDLGNWGELASERLSVTLIREARLQAEWTIIGGSNDNVLLDWEHEVEWASGEVQQSLKVLNYPAATPVIVYAPTPERTYVQRGRAVGLGAYIKPATPLFPDNLSAPEKVKCRRINDIERETTWEYTFVSIDMLVPTTAQLERPENPEVY